MTRSFRGLCLIFCLVAALSFATNNPLGLGSELFSLEEEAKIVMVRKYFEQRELKFTHLATKYKLSEQFATQILPMLEREALDRGLPPNLFIAICENESNFNPRTRSPKNCKGLMQVRGSTEHGKPVWIGHLKRDGLVESEADLYDPVTNIKCGLYVFDYNLRYYRGDVKRAINGYAGRGSNYWPTIAKRMGEMEMATGGQVPTNDDILKANAEYKGDAGSVGPPKTAPAKTKVTTSPKKKTTTKAKKAPKNKGKGKPKPKKRTK